MWQNAAVFLYLCVLILDRNDAKKIKNGRRYYYWQ
jgi:hypothetical protein